MSTLLYELIKDSYKGDQKATMEIIEKFTPILRKYSKKLNYYDGLDTDLVITLIETTAYLSRADNNEIADNEGCIVGYINKSIKNKYVKLSKSRNNIYKYELELDIGIEIPDEDTFYEDDNIFLNEMLDKLPLLQRIVIVERVLKEKPCRIIAAEMDISRQAVNSLKNRALKNLKAYMELETINIKGKGRTLNYGK